MLSARQATFNILRKMPAGYEFTGSQLQKSVMRMIKKTTMDGSATRHIREYRELYGVDIEVVNRRKSLYRIVG